MLQIRVELIFKLISPNRLAARSISQRVTTLDHLHTPRTKIFSTHQRPIHILAHAKETTHKFRNNPVEDDTVEVPTAGVPNEILHRLGCLVGEQSEVDISKCGVKHRRSRHAQCERFRGCGGGNRLFFPRRLFIEDVTVARLVPVYLGLACPLRPRGRVGSGGQREERSRGMEGRTRALIG